jgi:penicillin-binding protein 1C
MWDVSGVSGAAPVWRDVMDYLHRSTASRAPKPPAGVVRQQVRISRNWNPRAQRVVHRRHRARSSLVRDEHRSPKILYPGDASILALDPDIPTPPSACSSWLRAGGLRWHWTASRWRKPPLTTLAPPGQRSWR